MSGKFRQRLFAMWYFIKQKATKTHFKVASKQVKPQPTEKSLLISTKRPGVAMQMQKLKMKSWKHGFLFYERRYMSQLDIIKKLYIKHIYRDIQGIKSNRKLILQEYNELADEPITPRMLKDRILKLDKNELWDISRGNLPKRNYDDFGVDKTVPEGEYYSERYIELSTEQKYSPEEIMLAHGFNHEKWEVVTAGSTGSRIGTSANDEQYFINTYRKITVRPKQFKLTEDMIEKLVKTKVKPIKIAQEVSNPHGLLELTLTDMHFGNNDYDYYKPHQAEVLRYVHSQSWEEILIPIGNDILHWDNVNGTTTRGTQVGFQPDLNRAWEDALFFYTPIIEESIKKAKKVHIPYVKGNHDSSLGWAFSKLLEQRYPQAIHDTRLDNYKIHTWKKIAIGLSHGDEPREFKKYSPIFNQLFRKEFAEAEVREIHLGDKHHQMVTDEFGTATRGLSTASQTDKWHYNSGYIGASKVFQIFIYTENSIKAQIFIDGR